MSRLPKISIVIPSYNMGRYLPQCLTTIAKQKYPSVEVIIVDGDSTDCTHEVISRYRRMITRVISERDRGQPDAVTKGLRLVTGDIVHWHAADDIVLPGAFYRVAAEFDKNCEVDLVFSDGLAFTAATVTKGPTVRWVNFLDSLLFFGRFQSDCAYWRREITFNALPLDIEKQITCDEDFFLRMWIGRTYRWINQPLGAFRSHSEQVSKRFDRDTVDCQRRHTRQTVIERLGWSSEVVRIKRRHRAFQYWFFNRFAVKAYSGGRFALRKMTGDILRKRYSQFLLKEWIQPLAIDE